ncbi:hypothetical protein F66182_1488 [Fusarium sp. NRRL 66182]|nr:hypothetical protein F66182_1488 [Fusarium sp. NRRL 66182]
MDSQNLDFICCDPPTASSGEPLDHDSPGNPVNVPCLINGREVPRRFRALAQPTATKWRGGDRISVCFMGDVSQDLRRKIFQHANTWCQYANIVFDFIQGDDADVRIKVGGGGGNWSKLGKDCRRVPKDKPTLNLGSITEDSGDESIRRAVLHEFGHVLGCIHEHQNPSPSNRIQWNKPVVYADCLREMGWDKDKVDSQIINKCDQLANYSAMDASSIMMYPIRASWTVDGWSTGRATELSQEDKEWIREFYAQGSVHSEEERLQSRAQRLDETYFNYFNTMEVVDWQTGVGDASEFFTFDTPYLDDPAVAVGLNWLDSSWGRNVRVKSYLEDCSRDGFRLHLKTWADTELSSAACNWFKCAKDDPDYRVGEYESYGEASHWITFDRPYKDTPKVVVWLNGLDMHKGGTRIRVYADSVGPTGFRLHISTWASSSLNWASVSWIAHRHDMKGTASGTFGTNNTSWDHLPKSYRGTEHLEKLNRVETARRILLGISMMDLDGSCPQRIRTSADSFGDYELKWTIECWADSQLNNAKISYLVGDGPF